MNHTDRRSGQSTSRPSLRLYPDSLSSQDAHPNDACRENDSAGQIGSVRQQRELDRLAGVAEAKTVDLTMAQMVPLLMHAMENNRTWLSDFADDTVRIDADLYDVLLAYQQIIERKVA